MRNIFTTAFLITLSCLFAGCQTEDTFAQPPPETLQGEWIAQPDKVTLQFLPNNRFSMTVPGDEPKRLTGWAYYPQASHVSLKFDRRINICPDSTGVYLYSKEGGVLTFTVIQDDCEERVGLVGRSWREGDGSWF